ncbi:MAG: TOR complex subunit lst8 [Chaenotheca gracillima]|nr:MAG: TOR complex subunit lst8 [Chaenotheca gracillima]
MSFPPTSAEHAKVNHLDGEQSELSTTTHDALRPSSPATASVPGKLAKDASLDAPRASFDTIGGFSNVSADDGRTGRPLATLQVPAQRHASRSPAPPKTWKESWARFWLRNRGVALVLLAQFFGALMNTTTRLLETTGDGMDPMQILFARMSITGLLCCIWMWYKKIPDFPFGKREVRALLVARGLTGFFGVFGIYYALLYLPLSEATVLTFLAPIVACWACSYLLKEPFTRKEQIAGLVSLGGVVLIARPFSLLSQSGDTPPATGNADAGAVVNGTLFSREAHSLDDVTPAQRLGAVGVSLLGVVGAAGAYTTIRWIGKRAHPLLSVNYFATWCTIVSTVALLLVPGVPFKLPGSALEWFYLVFLGLCGFIMQFLLTAGLTHEKSSRATNMVYTQMLFALAFDKILWGTTPGVLSIIGSSLILGSAIYVALQKDAEKKKQPGTGDGAATAAASNFRDEERGLVDGMESNDDDADWAPQGPESMRGVQEVQLRTMRN